MMRGFEALQKGIKLPQRGTSKSAGYDIRSNVDVWITAGESLLIKTGLTSYMQHDEYLDLRIRSGLAFKYDLTMQNDAGVIDADYYGKEIGVLIRNEGTDDYHIQKGDRIAQGIFTKYLVIDDDKPVKDDREGGFGSTGKN